MQLSQPSNIVLKAKWILDWLQQSGNSGIYNLWIVLLWPWKTFLIGNNLKGGKTAMGEIWRTSSLVFWSLSMVLSSWNSASSYLPWVDWSSKEKIIIEFTRIVVQGVGRQLTTSLKLLLLHQLVVPRCKKVQRWESQKNPMNNNEASNLLRCVHPSIHLAIKKVSSNVVPTMY
jgi:hypothetical protein